MLSSFLIPYQNAPAVGGFSVGRSNSTGLDGNNSSFSIGWASGGAAVSGTFLAIVVATNTGAGSVSGGSAWTQLNVGFGVTIYYKICGGTEPTTYGVFYSGSASKDGGWASIVEILAPNATNPDGALSASSTATSPTVTSSNTADIGIILWGGSNTLPTPPAGWTTQTSIGDSKSGLGTIIATKVNTGSGSISPGAWSAAGSLVGTIVVKP